MGKRSRVFWFLAILLLVGLPAVSGGCSGGKSQTGAGHPDDRPAPMATTPPVPAGLAPPAPPSLGSTGVASPDRTKPRGAQSRVDQESIVNSAGTASFPQGWSLVGFPYERLAELQGLEEVSFFGFDPGLGYRSLERSELSTFDFSYGLWAWCAQPSTGQFSGVGFAPDTTQIVSLEQGWNLVSFRLIQPQPFQSMTIRSDRGTRPMSQAVSLATSGQDGADLYGVLYSFDGGTYEAVDLTNPASQTKPWAGYWVYAWRPAEVEYHVETAAARLDGFVSTEGGAGIGLAQVDVDGQNVSTDVYGSFTVDGLLPGEHLLKIQVPGYEPLERNVVLGNGAVEYRSLVLTPLVSSFVWMEAHPDPVEGEVPLERDAADVGVKATAFDGMTLPLQNMVQYSGTAAVLNLHYSTVWTGTYCGADHTRGEGSGAHPGVDIPVRTGTPVSCVANGTVTLSESKGSGWGDVIVVRHEVPGVGTTFSIYAHLSERLVSAGDGVSRGQIIAKSGATGGVGPHLHFQIDKDTGGTHPFWPAGAKVSCEKWNSQANNPGLAAQVRDKTFNPVIFVYEHPEGSGAEDRASFKAPPGRAEDPTISGDRIEVTAGESFTYTFYPFNNSQNTWNSEYAMHHSAHQSGLGPALDFEPVNTTISGGNAWTKRLDLVAPSEPQTIHVRARMARRQNGGFAEFGDTFSLTVVVKPRHYSARWVSQNEYPTLLPGESHEFEVRFQNTGDRTWTPDIVRLGTSHPQDRSTGFERSAGWISENRIRLVEDSVPPGAIGTFRFRLTVPAGKAPGVYREYFQPVAEGITWMEDWGVYWNVVVPIVMNHANASGSGMAAEQQLTPGTELRSPRGGRFVFKFQTDGNLVLYDTQSTWRPIWATGTQNSGARYCVMQGDGNLVLYTGDGRPLWASNTDRNAGSRLDVQEDGNVVIYRPDGRAVWATNTVASNPSSPYATGDVMQPGEQLASITSRSGRFTLTYQPIDGNLVLFDRFPERHAIWEIGGKGAGTNLFVMQNDGNFVLYRSSGEAVWATDTEGNPGSRLIVQDDGNVVIYRPDGTSVWATDTNFVNPAYPVATGNVIRAGEQLSPDQPITSPNGSYRLIFQKSDGNLVLSTSGGSVVRSWDTHGKGAKLCLMQDDGNFVLYDSGHAAVWATDTDGNPGSRLLLQDDRNVVIYGPDGKVVWASNTVGP